MAYCRTAPGFFLNQYWCTINSLHGIPSISEKIQCQSLKCVSNFVHSMLQIHFLGANELINEQRTRHTLSFMANNCAGDIYCSQLRNQSLHIRAVKIAWGSMGSAHLARIGVVPLQSFHNTSSKICPWGVAPGVYCEPRPWSCFTPVMAVLYVMSC